MAFRLAELFVEIGARTGGVNAVLSGLHARLLGMGPVGQAASGAVHSLTMGFNSLHGAIGSVGIMAGVALAGAVAVGLAHCASEAAHLQEAVAKTEQAFGSASPKIFAMADELQHKFGALKKEILDVAASFGLMLQGAGVTRELSAGMSVELSKIAVDAASFFDVSMQEAITRLQSGLSGEMEAVRRWGINLTESNIKQQAQGMGFSTKGNDLDQSTKTLIRYKLILEGLAAASGDAERSQYRFVGQLKLFQGQLYELAVNVGTVVVPVFTGLLIVINQIVGAFNWMMKTVLDSLMAAANTVAGWFGYDLTGQKETDADRAAIDARIAKTEEDQQADTAAAKLAEAAGKKEPKGWSGGLEDYAKHLQEGAWGGGKDQTAKDQLKEQQAQTKLLDAIKAQLAKPGPAVVI
jgi:hypothetical protein